MTVQPEPRADESSGCCCGTADSASNEAQPQKTQTGRHGKPAAKNPLIDPPDEPKGCGCSN